MIAKIAVYGFDKNILCYIYSYLKSRKRCVSINNIKINNIKDFRGNNISSSARISFVGPILFEIFFIDSCYFILVASAHNFANNKNLSSFAKTIENLISILESEREIAINWFKDNDVILNSGKYQAIIFEKHRGNHTTGADPGGRPRELVPPKI